MTIWQTSCPPGHSRALRKLRSYLPVEIRNSREWLSIAKRKVRVFLLHMLFSSCLILGNSGVLEGIKRRAFVLLAERIAIRFPVSRCGFKARVLPDCACVPATVLALACVQFP